MAIRREEAYVLKRVPLRETSLLATLLTRDGGKIKVLVKGVRGEKKPVVGRFEPFTHLEVVYYEKLRSDIHLVSDTAVLNSNSFLRSRLDIFSYASYAVELVDSLFEISDPHPEVFDLLGIAFRLFRSAPPARVARILEVKLLEKAGLIPILGHCSLCGKATQERTFFSSKQGGLICSDCDQGESGTVPISQGAVKSLLFYLGRVMNEAVELCLDKQIEHELERILTRFLHFRLEFPLRSSRFLSEVKPVLRILA